MIHIVNIKTYKPSESSAGAVLAYIGRAMPGRPGSPLGNPFKLRFEKDRAAILHKYEIWLRKQMESDTPARREIEHLTDYAEELVLACWCAPKSCHGDVVKRIIEERLANRNAATAAA